VEARQHPANYSRGGGTSEEKVLYLGSFFKLRQEHYGCSMIWLIGSKGMLEREVGWVLTAEDASHVCTDRELDIADKASLSAFLRERFLRNQVDR